MLKMKSTLGPAAYTSPGGFNVVFDEFEVIHSVAAKCDRDDILSAGDTQYALRLTVTGNVVNVQVWVCNAGAWAELAALALNGRTFTLLADGE
jgi:hypothetical protein